MSFNFLDVAFDWKDDKAANGKPPTDPDSPVIMKFGFGGDDTPYTEDPAKVPNDSSFKFSLFETSKAHDVKLPSVTITMTDANGKSATPFSDFSGGSVDLSEQTGDPNGHSSPLNTEGTGYGIGPFSVANEGTYLITVQIEAQKGNDKRYWKVDPELLVGPKKGGGGG